MKRKFLPALASVLVLALLAPWAALATDGSLPGGTTISVDITAPADGALIAYPPGDVPLSGTAAVGEGVPVPNTLLVYTLDVSFSTIRGDGGTGCGGDANGDGQSDTILDCEVAAAISLNNIAVSNGTVGEVGVAVFGGHEPFAAGDTGGAAADVGPGAGGQLLTGPATDDDSTGTRDVDQVLGSAYSVDTPSTNGGVHQFTDLNVGSNGTNFAAGLAAAVSVANASSMGTKFIIFMSDGLANTGASVASVAVPSDVIIKAFAIGTISNCTDDPNGLGSLQDVANKGAAGSSCTEVPSLANLPDVVPGIIASELTSLSLSVDGGAATDISSAASLPLPQAGPASVTYATTVSGLTPGVHSLCVTANGSDGGGAGSVTECINVTVADIQLAPETDTNELGFDLTHTVTATVAAGVSGGVAGVTVDFEVTAGPNLGAVGSGATDANGEAAFTYTAALGPAGLGTDTIEACFTDDLGVTVCDTAEKTWQDTTPPVVTCDPGVNPHGQADPKAPGQGGQGQNQDGFYQLNAEDAVSPAEDIQVFITDDGSGTVFGPYAVGTVIKYTQAPGATPEAKPIGSGNGQAGAVAWHITGNGDALLTATDGSGNTSEPVSCLVPPPPQ